MKHFITTVVPNWLRKRFSREKPFQGTLDAIIDGRVLGWARSAAHDGPIRIDLLIDGRVVAIDEPANVLRPDLRDAGIGDGAYGFEIAVPPECLGPDTLSVTIRPHGSEQAGLTQAMRFHREHGEYRPLQSINAASDITITIDSLTDDALEGWCVDSSERGRILELDIIVDGEFFVSIRNDGPRGDLEKLGISNLR